MEVMFETRWPNYAWLLDDTNGLLRDSPGAAKHMVPPVDVIEDKGTYHFYFDMPGLKGDSPDWPNETEVRMAERLWDDSPDVRAAKRRKP
jgi:hypothetical protein